MHWISYCLWVPTLPLPPSMLRDQYFLFCSTFNESIFLPLLLSYYSRKLRGGGGGWCYCVSKWEPLKIYAQEADSISGEPEDLGVVGSEGLNRQHYSWHYCDSQGKESERAMLGLGVGRVTELLPGLPSPRILEGTPAFTVTTARVQLLYEAALERTHRSEVYNSGLCCGEWLALYNTEVPGRWFWSPI